MKKQLIIIGSSLLALLALVIWMLPRNSAAEFIPAAQLPEEKISEELEIVYAPEPDTIIVDIKGSVKRPGIYEIEEGARVHDVVMMAGGLTEEAAPEWVNLAQRVTDEMVIFIYSVHDEDLRTEMPLASKGSSAQEESGLVNINRATAAELQTLPGIGATRAEAIIRYREESGPFGQIEDLQNVSGIGASTFENIRPLIAV